MSAAVVEQVKQLIDELSVNEKVGLVEWLGATLGQDLAATAAKRKKRKRTVKSPKPGVATANGHTAPPAAVAPSQDERQWTEEEIRKLMTPDPKTGAEIVALVEQLDLKEWREMDIPDVVEWLKNQRHEEAARRGLYWDESE